MRFNSTLFSSLLLVCTALARADNHPEEHQPQFVDSPSRTSPNIVARDEDPAVWAGARLQGNTSVLYEYPSVVFTMPYIWSNGGAANGFSIVVGVGTGAVCPRDQVNFTVGIDVSLNNALPCQAWASWNLNRESPPYGTFDISVGDTIKAGVSVTSPTTGYYFIYNLSKDQIWQGTFMEESTVCQQTVEWIIRAYDSTAEDARGPPVPSFSTLTFWNATALRSDSSIMTPSDGAYTNDVTYLNIPLTDVWIAESTMIING